MIFSFVSDGSTFVKALALGSVILCGVIRSAPLPPLSPNLEDPKPVEKKDENGKIFQNCVTISAGNTFFTYLNVFTLFKKFTTICVNHTIFFFFLFSYYFKLYQLYF